MAVNIFISRMLRAAEEERGRLDELNALAQEFREYKETGTLPKIFGRDAPYGWPASVLEAGVRHLHLSDTTVKRDWLKIVQYNRVSNTCLVYCQGELSKDNYLLIALLKLNAHERQRKLTFMMELADTAEAFRKKY